MKRLTVVLAGLVLSATAGASAALAQDAAAGAKIFQTRCAVCHGKTAAGGPAAPSLKGVVGAKAASSGWANYSNALKASGKVWTPANLNTFLTAPGKFVPGTKMVMMIPKPDERANVIAYLGTLKK